MTQAQKPHSDLLARVQAALAGTPPAPWKWDAEWDTLKAGDGRYVLSTRLDFHGKDENGEDDFTSHLDIHGDAGDADVLIALAPEMAAALVSLVEQLEAAEQKLTDIRAIDRGWPATMMDADKLQEVKRIAGRG